jgi:hypothetical protein
MDAFDEMVGKIREICSLYKRSDALLTAVASGGHSDTEAIRVPVYSFFLEQFLGTKEPLTVEGPVDEPQPAALISDDQALECRSEFRGLRLDRLFVVSLQERVRTCLRRTTKPLATSQDQSVQPRYAATWRGVCRSAY